MRIDVVSVLSGILLLFENPMVTCAVLCIAILRLTAWVLKEALKEKEGRW